MTSKRPPGRFHAAIGERLKSDDDRGAEARLRKLRGDPAVANPATVATPAPEPLPVAPVAKSAPVAKTTTVQIEPKDGYYRLPHAISDNLLRTLEPAEQLVYLRLYRLIHGFPDRTEIVVAYETLAKACNLGKRTAVRAVEGLVAKGLVAYEAVIAGPRGERGNRYRLPGAPIAKSATDDKPATAATVAPMKEIPKQSHESAVYRLRQIGATLREIHRDYSPERLREAVRDAADGQGLEYTAADLTEALRGM